MSSRLVKSFHLSALSSYLVSALQSFKADNPLFNRKLKSLVPAQVILEKGKVFRVPFRCRELHLLSGMAWLTVNGEDIILKSGETVSLPSNKGWSILSVLGNMPVTLEVL
ncbi:MAG TPA: hypothetical protein DCE56_25930 [Cyanobacteria bacterium UBA8553]|nr:hypothetical protein [Cyanobacteria bacterium UBA8553]